MRRYIFLHEQNTHKFFHLSFMKSALSNTHLCYVLSCVTTMNLLSTFHWRKQKPNFYVSYFLILSHFTFSEADLIFSQRFPLATSIVSRRSSRSYSHQTFWRPVRSASLTRVKITRAMFCQTTIAWGVVGGARYARRSHYQTARYRNAFCQR